MYGATPRDGNGSDPQQEDMQLLDVAPSAVLPVSPSAQQQLHHSATDSFSSSEKRGFYSPLHYESIDFDPFENQVYRNKTLERRSSDDAGRKGDW